MVKNKIKLIWDLKAKEHLRDIYQYIKKDSLSSAQKVKKEILSAIRRLPQNPTKYPPDRFKEDNPGSYRAFEVYSYRIAYEIEGNEIRILRVRHTSREPKIY